MFNPGDCIKVKTKTVDDVFGEVIYRVEEVGLKCPECKDNDAIKFVMLGGSGPAAREGYPIFDCPKRIRQDMIKGITQVLTPAQALVAVKFYTNKNTSKPGQGVEV